MPNTHVTKNYFTDNGNELVIGGKLTFLDGAEVDNFPGSNGSGNETTPIAYQADSEATTVAALKESFNSLLAGLRTSGLMAAAGEPEDTPDTQEQGEP